MNERRGIEIINLQDFGKFVQQWTGNTPELWTLVKQHQQFCEWAFSFLSQGRIPVYARLSEDGQPISAVPVLDVPVLKRVWGELTELTNEEMEEIIKKSGIYPDFE